MLTVLGVLDGLAPELWAALFWGAFCLGLLALRSDRNRDDEEED